MDSFLGKVEQIDEILNMLDGKKGKENPEISKT